MEIRVTSFNIRYDTPQDNNHAWKNRRKLAAGIVNNFSTNLLATQEGRKKQIKDFASLLPKLYLSDSHRFWIGQRMYPSIFFDPKHFDLMYGQDLWLSTTPHIAGSKSFGSPFPRIATWVLLKHKITNHQFIFINTHLDHLNEMTRFYQINVMISEIIRLRLNMLPIILCGDFNSSPQDTVRQEVVNKLNLIDPWIKLGLNEESSHHQFNGHSRLGHRIDWILHSDHFYTKKIFLNKINRNGIFPSDHFPVQAVIKLKLDSDTIT